MTEDNMNFEALLDPKDAAHLLNISPATLLKMARSGEVPAIKVGKLWRFRKSQLDEWLCPRVSSFRHPCRERKETDDAFAAKVPVRVSHQEEAPKQ
jgi:excisionase family DNA binding protein